MKKQLKNDLSKLSAKVLKSVAYSTADSACMLSFYQAKEPKALKNLREK